jgi:radical SAM protein with 4Fe4S-binding SPASM domain
MLQSVSKRLRQWTARTHSAIPGSRFPAPGLYAYRRAAPGESARVHLRLEADGAGYVLVNASRLLQLNPTAALMAYLALEETDEVEAVRLITRRYRLSRAQARSDYLQFKAQLLELVRPDGACPVCDLGLEVTAPFTTRPSAPYRVDLAVTYRCNNDCAHCYNIRPRALSELTTAQWQGLLDRLWEAGVPHVVFTGGEPTLRDDLPELIAHAERNGQVSGLNTNARRLSDPGYVEKLVEAGLDHVQVTLESVDPAIHDTLVGAPGGWAQTVAGLRRALAARLFVMTNTTLLRPNTARLGATLDFLADLGVPTVGLNALIHSGRGATVGSGVAEADLAPLLEVARERTTAHGQRLIWYTPTQYCHFNPVQLQFGVKGCTAALYSLCVEPNGDVLPCQSYYTSLGNLLNDDWASIWQHEFAVSLRERRDLPAACGSCTLLAECGGGCPLARASQSPEPQSWAQALALSKR